MKNKIPKTTWMLLLGILIGIVVTMAVMLSPLGTSLQSQFVGKTESLHYSIDCTYYWDGCSCKCFASGQPLRTVVDSRCGAKPASCNQ